MVSIPASCPFCHATIQDSVYLIGKGFLALHNIAPALPGHSLIIPQKHYTSLLDLTDEAFTDFFTTARKALKILMHAFQTDAFDWSIQEKPEAGQTIEHLHLHIVPRLKKDLKRPGDWYPLIQHNDQEIIDSLSRPRINDNEMRILIDHLRTLAMDLGLTNCGQSL